MSGGRGGLWTNSNVESRDKDVLVQYKYLSPQREREHQWHWGEDAESQKGQRGNRKTTRGWMKARGTEKEVREAFYITQWTL